MKSKILNSILAVLLVIAIFLFSNVPKTNAYFYNLDTNNIYSNPLIDRFDIEVDNSISTNIDHFELTNIFNHNFTSNDTTSQHYYFQEQNNAGFYFRQNVVQENGYKNLFIEPYGYTAGDIDPTNYYLNNLSSYGGSKLIYNFKLKNITYDNLRSLIGNIYVHNSSSIYYTIILDGSFIATDNSYNEFYITTSSFGNDSKYNIKSSLRTSIFAETGKELLYSNNINYLIIIELSEDNPNYKPTIEVRTYDNNAYDEIVNTTNIFIKNNTLEIEFPTDFTSWLGTAIDGFMSFEIIPNMSIKVILTTLLSFAVLIWFLKMMGGG